MSARHLVAIILFSLITGLGCQQAAPPAVSEPAEPVTDGVFLHVSSGTEDPHRVLMALKMAELMAVEKDVLVYFDIKGIEVVLADSEDIVLGDFPSSKTQLSRLLELGVPIYACPGCLAAAEKTPEDLAAGIQVADKEAFFGFTAGRILTLDY